MLKLMPCASSPFAQSPWFGSPGLVHRLGLRPMEELHSTPAGRQPYMDFWYNNTWDPQAQYPGNGSPTETRHDNTGGCSPGVCTHHGGEGTWTHSTCHQLAACVTGESWFVVEMCYALWVWDGMM